MNFLFVLVCGVWRLSVNHAQHYGPVDSEQLYKDGYEYGDPTPPYASREMPRKYETEERRLSRVVGSPPSKEIEEDDENLEDAMKEIPWINRGPPTRGETYKYAATMYTHLHLTRLIKKQTRKPNATTTPSVFFDQYFVKNQLKTKIRVIQIKKHYWREYEHRLNKMMDHCRHTILDNYTKFTWDELMDIYRDYREDQLIKADDRMFNKFVRRMDTVLQSGRYEKWQFHLNTTRKPWFNDEQNFVYTDKLDQKMIMEIRSLARSLRKQIHFSFNYLDNNFLQHYFRIPYNHSLYYQHDQPLNYTEQF